MGRSFLPDSRIFLGKREAVAGTAEALVDADFDVRARDVELSDLTVEFDDESSKYATGDHTKDEAVPGKETIGMSFNVKMSPPELTGDTPTYTGKFPVEKYLESAGLDITFDAALGTYTCVPQVSADVQTLTAAILDRDSVSLDLIQYKMAGAMSELEIVADGVSKPFIANFSLKGKVDSVSEITNGNEPELSDAALIHTPALKNNNTVIKITEVNNDGTTASPLYEHQFCVNAFNFKPGATINQFECQEDNSGLLYYAVTSRAPELTIAPLLELISDFPFWESITSSTKYKIEITKYTDVAKTVTGITLTIPIAQMMTPSISESNGFLRNELTWRALRNIQGADATARQHDFTLVFYGVDQD